MAYETSMLDDRIDAFAEGREARDAGQPITTNPYPTDSAEHLSWNDGWIEADDD